MASPLLPYANSRVLIRGEGAVSLEAGRIVAAPGTDFVLSCFMKRAQYSGVSSGSKRVPLESQMGGFMMPGAGGDTFYYRGYALLYAELEEGQTYIDPAGDFVWTVVDQQYSWFRPGVEVLFQFGEENELHGRIERSSGIYGGLGIDRIIYEQIGGVELQITGGELLN